MFMPVISMFVYPKLDLPRMPMVSCAMWYFNQQRMDRPNLGAGTSGFTVCMAMQLSLWLNASMRHILKAL